MYPLFLLMTVTVNISSRIIRKYSIMELYKNLVSEMLTLKKIEYIIYWII